LCLYCYRNFEKYRGFLEAFQLFPFFYNLFIKKHVINNSKQVFLAGLPPVLVSRNTLNQQNTNQTVIQQQRSYEMNEKLNTNCVPISPQSRPPPTYEDRLKQRQQQLIGQQWSPSSPI
jgi:hypothetical protein